MNQNIKLSGTKLRIAALTAGISLLIMTVLAFIIFPSLQASTIYVIGIVIIIILDIIIAIALYVLLKSVNQTIAVLMSAFRIIYAIVFAIALYNISDLERFNTIWSNGLLLFGIHLLLLGWLVYKAAYIPKIFGLLIVMSSAGYIFDSIINYLGYTLEIGMFTFWGEVVFALWLVIKSTKISIEPA